MILKNQELSNTFLWGAASSAHQVEGNNRNNDWWQWEQRTPGIVSSGQAADHYHRFKEDFALAKQLGHTAHRLSLEWSRLEPHQGDWDVSEEDHYRQVLTELRRLGLASFVTLHHFSNPQWFASAGGWEARQAPQLFAAYAKRAARAFGDLVDFWVTINEPNVLAAHGYWFGWWPPQRRSLPAFLRATRHLIEAHRLAFAAIRRERPAAHIGIALSLIGYFPSRRWHPGDQLVAWLSDWAWNHYVLNRVASTCDFLGLQYYFSRWRYLQLLPPKVVTAPWAGETTDLGWPITPQGLAHELKHLRRYQLPMYVTENGLADAADTKRADFIQRHIHVIEEARRDGADIRGYLHWSLLDNFEWTEGFKPRFGLVEVDYATQERRVRPSAVAFKHIIEESAPS